MAMTAATTPDSGLEILDKANAVLEALERRSDLSVAEIAEATGEPVSSTYRLLTSLTGIGWVDPSGRRGRYRLGLELMTIGGAAEERMDTRALAGPTLRALLASTGNTSYLCIRRGTRGVCIERFDGRDVRSLALQLGESLPLYAGAAPRALLAFLPEAERAALVADRAHGLPGDPEPPTARALEAELARIRAAGYAHSDEDVTPGIGAIGAPVFNHRGELEAALSVSGLRESVLGDGGETVRAVLAAAREVSALLGWRGEGAR